MRLRIVLLTVMLSGVAPMHAQDQPRQLPPPEFVPVEGTPQGEQIPAMPLLGAAYGFIWVGLLGYVWSIARRLKTVESELSELESRRR